MGRSPVTLSCFPSRSFSSRQSGSALADSPAPAQDPPPPAEPEIRIDEEVTVTATRLPNDEPAERRLVPAHVTVITRDEIERSGARTLQDLLTLEAGALVFDQIGNDVQKSFDLRGFAGSGTRVFLDGSPINDPRNNSVALELVPLRALDRIEITRGSVAALAGGGSEAGAINLWTRHGAESGASIEAAAGDFETHEARASIWRNWGVGDLFASGNCGGDRRLPRQRRRPPHPRPGLARFRPRRAAAAGALVDRQHVRLREPRRADDRRARRRPRAVAVQRARLHRRGHEPRHDPVLERARQLRVARSECLPARPRRRHAHHRPRRGVVRRLLHPNGAARSRVPPSSSTTVTS